RSLSPSHSAPNRASSFRVLRELIAQDAFQNFARRILRNFVHERELARDYEGRQASAIKRLELTGRKRCPWLCEHVSDGHFALDASGTPRLHTRGVVSLRPTEPAPACDRGCPSARRTSR